MPCLCLNVLPQHRSASSRWPFFSRKFLIEVRQKRLTAVAKFGFNYLRSKEEERWTLQRRCRFCSKVHYCALRYKEFSKSLCKKWETGSESSPCIHCEVKNGEGNSLFYPPVFCSDDEHLLIQHYCQSLNQESPLSQPRSPAQILISLESEERGELERILADLEEENRWVIPPAAAPKLSCSE